MDCCLGGYNEVVRIFGGGGHHEGDETPTSSPGSSLTLAEKISDDRKNTKKLPFKVDKKRILLDND